MSKDPRLSAEQERLLDLAIGRGTLPNVSDGLGGEAAALREFVQQTRASLSVLDTMDAARLELAKAELAEACEERIAASGHPGIFGDFVLGFEFFKARLKRNAALRMAAASLLVHLTALPVLAWFAFAKPEPGYITIRFEEAPVVLTEEPGDEILDMKVEDAIEVLDAELKADEKSDMVLESEE
jgi:hypothetical protein